MKKYFTDLSMQLLHEYNWPGNIRELKNIVERAIIISPADAIKPENLHIHSPNKPIVIIKEKDFGENSKNSLTPPRFSDKFET